MAKKMIANEQIKMRKAYEERRLQQIQDAAGESDDDESGEEEQEEYDQEGYESVGGMSVRSAISNIHGRLIKSKFEKNLQRARDDLKKEGDEEMNLEQDIQEVADR